MRILITGGCGFVGSNLAIYLKKNLSNSKIFSLDNLYRNGSQINKKRLKIFKIINYKINIQDYKKISKLPKFDLIIDCCAEPAIEISDKDPDRIINTNLIGTFNILKKCQRDKSKIIFLSTSRVYSIDALRKLIKQKDLINKVNIKFEVNEKFQTNLPKSLYGFSKLSSEDLIKEYNYSNKIKYIINRFGVIAGPWQFGKQDQGFVPLWVAKHFLKSKLAYIGFGGNGAPQNPSTTDFTESWNGTNWTAVGTLNTGRNGIGQAGTSTTALAAGGEGGAGLTEEWNAGDLITTVTTT